MRIEIILLLAIHRAGSFKILMGISVPLKITLPTFGFSRRSQIISYTKSRNHTSRTILREAFWNSLPFLSIPSSNKSDGETGAYPAQTYANSSFSRQASHSKLFISFLGMIYLNRFVLKGTGKESCLDHFVRTVTYMLHLGRDIISREG